jgi:CheY-like chemotaxis protein
LKVLIVDDDPDIREAMSEMLALEGHGTACASDGREALEILRRTDFAACVILLDLRMPVMNGWEFREEQRRDPKIAAIPVIVITADESAARTPGLEAEGILRKPIRGDDLVRLVSRFCPASS